MSVSMPQLTAVNEKKNSMDYWKDRMHGLSPSQYPWTDPSQERPSPSTRKEQAIEIDCEIIHLPLHADWYGCTAMICSAWSVVLASYTGFSDVCFGLAMSHPDLVEKRRPFPFRTTIRDVVSLREFLNSTEERIREDLEHNDIDVHLAQPSHRTWDRWSQSSMILEIFRKAEGPMEIQPCSLALQCIIDGHHLQLKALYNPECIAKDEVKRALTHLRNVRTRNSRKGLHKLDMLTQIS
ncbi:hypothetical protein POX_g09209 [Penicillium oxalicum]|uniref:hypothetical protein n=1 Tax=Penicillium oxalicum TaxID=69781 RepID=UPI0020B8EBBA|nr:hypothetical protein POX_g09209 [Penicillium oxalicum]KAI2786814.1 hypothetical protein POX_g09209 [Penicillium oxalicum]